MSIHFSFFDTVLCKPPTKSSQMPMNLKVDVIESEEGPGYGGAMLAAVGCGEFETVEEAAEKLVRIVDTVEPETGLVEKYEKRYQVFKQIYPAMKGLFQLGM